MEGLQIKEISYQFEITWEKKEDTQEESKQSFTLRYNDTIKDAGILIVDKGIIEGSTFEFAEFIFNFIKYGFEEIPKPIKSLTIVRGKDKRNISVSADEDFQKILNKFAKASKIV